MARTIYSVALACLYLACSGHDANSVASNSGGGPCAPNAKIPCVCGGDVTGTRTCASNGEGFGECSACPGGGPIATKGVDDAGAESDSSGSSQSDAIAKLGDPGPAPSAPPLEVALSSSNSPQGDTRIALAAKSGHVAVAWAGFDTQNQPSIYYRISFDLGSTWGPVSVASEPNSVSDFPSLASDSNGNFYLAWVTQNPNSVQLAFAASGSATFGSPISVNDSNETQSGCCAYASASVTITDSSQIVVTWARLDRSIGTSSILAARNTTLNAPWITEILDNNIPPEPVANFSAACTSGSRLWVVWYSNGQLFMSTRGDSSAAWGPRTLVASNFVAEDVPACAARGGDLWIVYGQASNPPDVANAILVSHSANGGTTFDAPVNAMDMRYGTHPQITLESAGALDIAFYAGASLPDYRGSYRFARSTNGGGTFFPSQALKAPIRMWTNANRENPGFYDGIVWFQGGMFASYAENASGTAAVLFSRVAVP